MGEEINEILARLGKYILPRTCDYSSEGSGWNQAIHRFADEIRPVLTARNEKIRSLQAQLSSVQVRLGQILEEYKRFRDRTQLEKESWQEYVRGKVAELESIIVEANECTNLNQERNDNLKSLLEVFDAKCKRLQEEQQRLNRQIDILKNMIVDARMAELCWCDKCCERRNPKHYRENLLVNLTALVVTIEEQQKKKQNNRYKEIRNAEEETNEDDICTNH